MKQAYSITRSTIYKNILKNKHWKVERITYTFQGLAYVYGCNFTKGEQSISIEPLFTNRGARKFRMTYRRTLSDVGETWNHVDMTFVRAKVNKIVFDSKPPKLI